ncbi:MAG: hypothetical protein PUF78_01000 [Lachnospiraceae bacterium]|jgi:hypothetical protein|nr:hypothetical protein [Lachnospiraceae bacterium]
MDEKDIIAVAKKNSYDTAKYAGEWHGYDVWVGEFTDGKKHEVGLPLFILVKDGKYKLGYDSWMQIMDDLFPYSEDEEKEA